MGDKISIIEKYNELYHQEHGKTPNKKNRISVEEALSTPDASILIPRVISDVMREAAEPMYIGSEFFEEIQLEEGRSIEFPSVGAIRAFDIPEGGEYPNQELEFQLHKTQEVKVGKVGLKVQITEEMITDSQWDVIAMHLRAAGRAMARHKEEKSFHNMSKHGHIVLDNKINANDYPHLTDDEIHAAKPSGRDKDGKLNGTLATDDVLDMIMAVMANGYTPTDILMHPLTWTIFAKNALLGSLGNQPAEQPNNGFALGPESVQGRIPFGMNVWLSPFIPFNREEKTYDMYVVDRNEVGVLLTKEGMSTEQFDNPYRDIQTLKVKERYGIGVLDEGRAVATARNITFDKTWPEPERYRDISDTYDEETDDYNSET